MEPIMYINPAQATDLVRKRRFIVILFAIVVVLILLAFYQLYVRPFRVVGANPNTAEVATTTPFFNVSFNKPLSEKNLSVASSPSVIKSYGVKGKTLSINLNYPMDSAKTYRITINIADTTGNRIANRVFSFKPHYIAYQDLPQDQQQYQLKAQTQYNQSVEDNKLVALLPFTGPNFEYHVDYDVQDTAQGNQLIIEITAPTPQAQQDATNWVKSQSTDFSKLTIHYINEQP